MTLYVDQPLFRLGRMKICHMWSDCAGELIRTAEEIGLKAKWLQAPPQAQWIHFDISLNKRKQVLRLGAIETDRYGCLYHVAQLRGDQRTIDRIDAVRQRKLTTLEDTQTAP
jgi:hypothetical protein